MNGTASGAWAAVGSGSSRATSAERAVAAVLVSAELFVSIVGNLLVLFVSLWDEHVKQHRSNLLVVSLAVTDLLTATLIMVCCARPLARSAPFSLLGAAITGSHVTNLDPQCMHNAHISTSRELWDCNPASRHVSRQKRDEHVTGRHDGGALRYSRQDFQHHCFYFFRCFCSLSWSKDHP
ncbi:hypothetical protein HPB48_012286 [Haemaphysalis longicornis]|uniref:G-protein coupled receptors family 1 profile domain-containing protein n=1 Tax=Haemaphysalis longicornis TaxID=44386 RepID=A0A9J6GL78_HAELO|nr:hypothetical protein HPB48_012286 [Haemaphysalis longicornis]